MWYGGHGFGNWFGFGNGGWIMGIIAVLIVVVIVLLVRNTNNGTGWRGPAIKDSPMEILKRRFSEGDISREEFEKMKRDIRE